MNTKKQITKKEILKRAIYLEARRQALQALLKSFSVDVEKKGYEGQLSKKKEYKRQLEAVEEKLKIFEYLKTIL